MANTGRSYMQQHADKPFSQVLFEEGVKSPFSDVKTKAKYSDNNPGKPKEDPRNSDKKYSKYGYGFSLY
jgi:hypothetical protein